MGQHFGKALKAAIAAEGITQDELAVRLRKTPGYVSQLVNGHGSDPSDEQAAWIARTLGREDAYFAEPLTNDWLESCPKSTASIVYIETYLFSLVSEGILTHEQAVAANDFRKTQWVQLRGTKGSDGK